MIDEESGGAEQGRFTDITKSADLYIDREDFPVMLCVRDTPGVKIYLKLEYMNPGGSVKDRIATRMIEAAEAGQARGSRLPVTMAASPMSSCGS